VTARAAALFLLAALAAGCTRAAPPREPFASQVPLSEREAVARLDTGLRVNGLLPLGRAEGPGPIEAVGTGPASRGWADCPTLRLTDPSRRTNRSTLVAARQVTTRVLASVQPVTALETRVAVRAEPTGLYVNPFTNGTQRASCSSTGALERSLLGALSA
jgi:hypothetical protein